MRRCCLYLCVRFTPFLPIITTLYVSFVLSRTIDPSIYHSSYFLGYVPFMLLRPHFFNRKTTTRSSRDGIIPLSIASIHLNWFIIINAQIQQSWHSWVWLLFFCLAGGIGIAKKHRSRIRKMDRCSGWCWWRTKGEKKTQHHIIHGVEKCLG